MPFSMSARVRSPGVVVLSSSLLAAIALSIALWLTRAPSVDAWHTAADLTVTPERAAESFVEAFRRGAYARAASFATGALARSLRTRPPERAATTESDRRRFVLQESHWLRQGRLRLVGVLVNDGEDESAGQTVALTLMRREQRYFVEDVQWNDPPGEDL